MRLEARGEAWQGANESEGVAKERFAKIARLMSAIHNIPGHLIGYESWDQRYFEACLGSRETQVGKWLHAVYSNALEEARKQKSQEASPDADVGPV
jgi:hypothetical protein